MYYKKISYICIRKVRYAFYVCYIYNKTQWNGLPVRVAHLFCSTLSLLSKHKSLRIGDMRKQGKL